MSRQTFGRKTNGTDGAGAFANTVPQPGRTVDAPLGRVSGAPGTVPGVELKPSADSIRKRAYELFMERVAKGRPGDERTDWLQAEKELRK